LLDLTIDRSVASAARTATARIPGTQARIGHHLLSAGRVATKKVGRCAISMQSGIAGDGRPVRALLQFLSKRARARAASIAGSFNSTGAWSLEPLLCTALKALARMQRRRGHDRASWQLRLSARGVAHRRQGWIGPVGWSGPRLGDDPRTAQKQSPRPSRQV